MPVGLAVAALLMFVIMCVVIAREDAWWDGDDIE